MRRNPGSVCKTFKNLVLCLCLMMLAIPSAFGQQGKCFTEEARATAERTARVWHDPDPGYDPVLGYNPRNGPRAGAPPVNNDGLGAPINCVADPKEEKGTGTTPKFYCTVAGVKDAGGNPIRYKIKPQFKGSTKEKRNGEIYGEFLSSRFSQALGFYADDEWVADVTCPDCEKILTAKFQGAKFDPFQPAAGIELSLGKGIDEDCDDKDTRSIEDALEKLVKSGSHPTEVDAFKIWLAFIDHGDTKSDNQKFSCLKVAANGNDLTCEQPVYYVSDMGSTFGYSSASENKARLAEWKKREDPIKMVDGKCMTTAKSVGNPVVNEQGRVILATQLQKLLDAESQNGLITRVFRASRNGERDEAPEAWTAEFVRRAKTIISARCP